MEMKTKVIAEAGKQNIMITRDFDLPVELLFRAHVDAELFEQWMSHEYGTTKVRKMECKNHGGWQFETIDKQGNVVFTANGVIHDFVPDQRITRTFEMMNSPVQLEFLEFEKLSDDTSRLNMQIVFRSVECRDQLLKNPFAQGMNMGHNRLQEIVGKLK
ncbi:SRPBCC domain-containing protein [Longitalea arenae]|uniref:SRPBCC domain-containing protein n=1 Tax=Longitalea arenae TaxID=2812558 RepID=UPI001967FC54|nr:SRPBCC domain-containing protein [Longitalea arenae]